MRPTEAQLEAWPVDFLMSQHAPVEVMRALGSLCDFAAPDAAVYCSMEPKAGGGTDWVVLAVVGGWLSHVTCSVPAFGISDPIAITARARPIAGCMQAIELVDTRPLDHHDAHRGGAPWSATWSLKLSDGEVMLPDAQAARSAQQRDAAERLVKALLAS